ncbi:MAG: Holliday junction branch migration protein RuvA [Myxococcales bacterium]
MIGRLTGIIVDQTLDGACVVDVSGVGYEVFVPLGALGRLARATERVTLHVHTQMREDALTLYGFPTLEDRTAFRTLLGVNGVGPKLALGIMGSLTASELADALNRGDKARFKGISGVGPKIVERLVLELKDKLHFVGGAMSAPMPAPKSAPQSAFTGILATVHGALVQMGFKPFEAETALQKIQPKAEGKAAEELLREALASLA